jgi:hypothetical protein
VDSQSFRLRRSPRASASSAAGTEGPGLSHCPATWPPPPCHRTSDGSSSCLPPGPILPVERGREITR